MASPIASTFLAPRRPWQVMPGHNGLIELFTTHIPPQNTGVVVVVDGNPEQAADTAELIRRWSVDDAHKAASAEVAAA